VESLPPLNKDDGNCVLHDADGEPLDKDLDVEGIPLDQDNVDPLVKDEDIDGEPFDIPVDDADGEPLDEDCAALREENV
jgi:hypothetical protein